MRVGIVLLLLASFFMSVLNSLPALAESTALKIIDDDFLQVSYQVKQSEKSNLWKVVTTRKTNKDDCQQRVKIKVLREDGEVIDYPDNRKLYVKNDWWIEKEFQGTEKKEFSFTLPKDEKRVQLFVEVEEKSGSHNTEKDNDHTINYLREQAKPIWLKLSSDTGEDSEEKVKTKKRSFVKGSLYSESLEIPKKSEEKLLKSGGRNLTQGFMYNNKTPQYTTDSKGTYPTPDWQPNNQENVINHQGGHEMQSTWDGIKNWNVEADDYSKSYIHYGDLAKPNLSLRKYAKQTDVENEFDVQMNVRGRYKYEPGVDIVFLLDNSYSMRAINRKKNAADAFDRLITEIQKMVTSEGLDIRVGGNIFAGYQSEFGWPDSKTLFKISDNPADWTKISQSFREIEPNGNTHTERALAIGRDLFYEANSSGGTERKKMLFLLTDGGPTMSWVPVAGVTDNSMYFDPVRITSVYARDSSGNYLRGSLLGNNVYLTGLSTPYRIGTSDLYIRSHITPTVSRAKYMQEAGMEIHTLAIGISASDSNPLETHTNAELLRGLYKIASKKVDATGDSQGDYLFYEAGQSSEIATYLKKWYDSIVRAVNDGKIDCELDDMVELVEEPTVTQVAHPSVATIDSADFPNASSTDNERKIKVENINLYGGQEIQVNYRVRLKTEDNQFVSKKWYPINTKATLMPVPEQSKDKLDFGIPSVRAKVPDFKIPVEKHWEDKRGQTDNYWELRKPITAYLQKNENGNWTDIQEVELNSRNNWKAEFDPVMSGSDHSYRVIEKDRVTGYAQPEYNQNSFTSETMDAEGVLITNRLLKTDFSMKKVGHDGKTPFDLPVSQRPKFTLKKGTKEIIEEIVPSDDGTVKFTDLPIGNYTITESFVPEGYEKVADKTLIVTEKTDGSGVEARIDGSEGPYVMTNKLKDFTLTVEKVNERGQALEGASFRLTGTNYNQTKNQGSAFTFTGLKPGTYQLEETRTPGGHIGLDQTVTIQINEDGTVVIGDNKDVEGSGGITSSGNKINLKIKNTSSKQLPSTGGSTGYRRVIATGLIAIGISLCWVYAWMYRKKLH